MRRKHEGFILLEAVTSLMISIMIIFTLTLCVSEQFKLLNNWEQRVNAHRLILQHLEYPDMKDQVIIKNQKYYFQRIENKYQVTVNKNVYQINIM